MIEPEIIYEDENFLAVNKPAGLLVHDVKPKAQSPRSKIRNKTATAERTLVDWLLTRYPEIKTVGDDPISRPGIVHRLDKETSGIMVIAKNPKYFEYLKTLFKTRQIRKKYLALLWGELMPKEGIIEKPIGIKDGTIKRSVHSQKMAKEAVTKYRVIRYIEAPAASGVCQGRPSSKGKDDKAEIFSLVEIEPLTGRTHQIRVHMASTGHPVVGDTLYGRKAANRMKARLMLHAFSLEFTSDDGKRLRLQADSPADYLETLRDIAK